MAVRKITEYPEAVLAEVGKPVTEFDAALAALCEEMFETMYDAEGVGLAAPQIGLNLRLFVMDCDAFGGIAGAEQAISTLIAGEAKMRVMLVSREFDVPAYPLGRRTAVCLPEDVSDTSFRIGFDHVLRDRAAITMN